MDLNWSEDTFSVQHLIENVEFPQLLRISGTPQPRNLQQHGAKTRPHFTEGDILKLHGVRTFKKVIVTGAGSPGPSSSTEQVANEYGYLSPPGNTTIYSQFKLPITYSKPLQILPFRSADHVYETAGDLVKERPRPAAVIVNKTITLQEKHCVIKEGDILAITSVVKRCTSAGVVDFLICKHNDKAIGLPMSCVGNFTVLRDEATLTLNDLVDRHIDIGLPQKIAFQQPPAKEAGLTLIRGGEHHIVPQQEYIVENIIKQQYLICTKCEDNMSMGQTKVYFIPTNGPAARYLRVHLPLFHDLKSYKQTLNSRYCPNLSMRDIADATPIESVSNLDITIKRLSEVYMIDSPKLPPRKDNNLQETVSLRSSASSSSLLDARDGQGSNYANVKVIHSRMNSSESNLTAMTNGHHAAVTTEHRPLVLPPPIDQMHAEEQPLLGDGGSTSSPRQTRRSGHNKTPVLQRKGTSTPCTPESRRRKNDSPTWTEKISISLENLKRTFRKAGSEERERNRLGDGSQLADSFENLSMCAPDEEASTSHSNNYENVKLVASQLSKSAGRSRPTLKQPLSGIPPSKCSQIRELWTPPCSPDYRDHTTPSLEPLHTGFPQFNNSNSNPVTSQGANQPGADCNPLQKSATEPAMTFNYQPFDQPQRFSKSPRAAPRQSKETQNSFIDSSHCVYENMESISPSINRCPNDESGVIPPSRCSGYSSGSRGSSENDLIHYQLETIKSVDMIPDDLTTLSVPGLCDCLHLFELPNVAHKFKQNQIDGQFFMIMTDQMFRDEAFSLSEFEVLKLKRLREGWRPKL